MMNVVTAHALIHTQFGYGTGDLVSLKSMNGHDHGRITNGVIRNGGVVHQVGCWLEGGVALFVKQKLNDLAGEEFANCVRFQEWHHRANDDFSTSTIDSDCFMAHTVSALREPNFASQ